MVLMSIQWPQAERHDDSDDDDNMEAQTLQVTGFFRQFVEKGRSIHYFRLQILF